MKKMFGIFLVSMMLVSALAFAGDMIPPAPADSAIPGWIPMVLNQIAMLPGVGPILVKVVMILSVVAGVLTALSVCAMSIFAALKKGFSSVGLESAEAKTKSIADKVMPILQYLSMFNVQKK